MRVRIRLVFLSSRRRHTRCALVTGVQTSALPIYVGQGSTAGDDSLVVLAPTDVDFGVADAALPVTEYRDVVFVESDGRPKVLTDCAHLVAFTGSPHDVARGIGELACSYRQWAVGLGEICAHAVKLQAGEGGQFGESDLAICCDPAEIGRAAGREECDRTCISRGLLVY